MHRISLGLFTALLVFASPVPGTRVLEIKEYFGVSHPDQIIDFDLAEALNPATTWVSGPDGREVTYQLLEGGKKIALQTDLPAGSSKSWEIHTGRAPARPQDALRVVTDRKAGWHAITNGLTGVRIPLGSGKSGPPLRGVLLRSGTWLTISDWQAPAAKSIQVRFLERGPLVIKAVVAYAFSNGKYYHCTVTVEAGQPSILFEEESNAAVSWSLHLEPLRPSQARYRNMKGSTSPEAGHEPDGRQYRSWTDRPHMDALVDLKFDKPHSYPNMPVWVEWLPNRGWYWQVYDEAAPRDADLAGVFPGRSSRAWFPARSGVSLHTGPDRAARFVITCAPDSPASTWSRFQWGLFVATKAELPEVNSIQPIALQRNLHGGINLNKIHRLRFDFDPPAGGFGSPFMDGRAMQDLIAELRRDGVGGSGAYARALRSDSEARDLIDMWADSSGSRVGPVAERVSNFARTLLNMLVHRDGVYDYRYHYWMGGLEMSRSLLRIDQVLASDLAGEPQKARMRQAAVLFASVLWDDDFVPLHNPGGIGTGTPNMPIQQWGYRDQYALFLSRHPMMTERSKEVPGRTAAHLRDTIDETGAHMGAVHYVLASMGPDLTVMQHLKRWGISDLFRDSDRMKPFAEFYMNFVTPPEPRFGGLRKFVAVGDSSTESSELYGQMATGFADVDPELSKRLMGIWRSQGSRHSSFHGTTLLKIDESLPGKPAGLGNANFPRYYTVLRRAYDKPEETAIWFINGQQYYDHTHCDQGEVVIYALGAPLSLDWGSIYYPRVSSAYLHSLALPESVLPHSWDSDAPPLDVRNTWGIEAGTRTVQEQFLSFAQAARVRARMTSKDGSYAWTRAVSLAGMKDDLPVLLLEDSYSGSAAGAAKVFTLNLAARGAVETPAGRFTPPERGRQELPSAGDVFPVAAGVTRMRFQGQDWPAHPARGIDWDIYVVAAQPQQARIGNWAHAWAPGPEMTEFQAANGRAFEERQHLLRIRGTEGFRVLILPYKKGTPRQAEVSEQGGVIRIREQSQEVRLGPSFCALSSGSRRSLASFGSEPVEADGIRIQGGPAEVVIDDAGATITAHGPAGTRNISLPGAWRLKERTAAAWRLPYDGGAPATVRLEKQ
jgi:hypothetical protein